MPTVFRPLAVLGAGFFLLSTVVQVHAAATGSTIASPAPVVASPAPVAASAIAPPASPAPVASTPVAAPASDAKPATIALDAPAAATPAPDTAPVAGAAPSHKKTHAKHHKKSRHTKKHASSKKKTAQNDAKAQLKDAQTHLANLGYYKGKPDGIMGPKTRAAIKKFQKEHKLPATGKLTKATYDAIVEADKAKAMSSLPVPPMPIEPNPMPPPAPAPDFYSTHPDFYGYYHHSYENPVMLGSPQTLSSRFAKLDLSEDAALGASKRYSVLLNGLPLILVENQPSVIGVSKTFTLGNEDVIIFTSFKDNDPVCAYAYHLLILSANNPPRALEINNCTRGYQAKVTNDTLFITFPESEDARNTGNTWRYDHGDLERL